MKKTSKQTKRLLLSTETVRKLQPLDDQQLEGVVGGYYTLTACPYSVVKPGGG